MRSQRLATALLSSLGLLGLAACAVPAAQTPLGHAPGSAAAANAAGWPAASSPLALSSAQTEAAITVLMEQMTLEQKVGQLIQADISAITPADLKSFPLGSILAGGNSGPGGNERASAAQWRDMVAQFHAASRASGAKIPILFGVDAVHGHSNLPGATIFPHNIGLGAAHDPALIERIGAATAAEIAGSGIEWTFAPTLAVPQDPRWGRTYEGYSSDPALIARYATAMTVGLQGRLQAGQPLAAHRVAATAKHFLADGGTQGGRDQGDARMPEAELVARHAQGYPAAIDAGVLTVMASFSSWNGIKHHGNHFLLTDVLKGRMGFAGLVVGDWNGHGQIPGCTATACPAAINAGIDLLMAPDSWKGLFQSTLAAARSGQIPAGRLDDAVRRILRVKFKLGLMGPALTRRDDTAAIGAPEHLALAREAVAQSLVLLKNTDSVLPIRPGARVLITGPGADSMAMQAGGWTISWQGGDTTAADFPKGQTIGRAIAAAVQAAGGQAAVAADLDGMAKPDVAVIVLGERPYAEFEGDLPDLAFQPSAADVQLIARLKAQGSRIVIVFLSGRPLFTGPLLNQADAFVAAWLPGSQGQGVADVLVAQADGKPLRDFTGRLSFAWPSDGRAPVAAPLFPIGFGASYAAPFNPGLVNEDPRVGLSAADQRQVFLVRGKAPAPWRLVMDGLITARAVDLGAQEDAQRFVWKGRAALAIEGAAVDLSAEAAGNFALLIEWQVEAAGTQPVTIALAGGRLEMSSAIRALPRGAAAQTQVPLRCFASAGANFAAVSAPFRIEADRGFVATVRSVRLVPDAARGACPAGIKPGG